MLTSPALLSMVSSRSASTRAISTLSTGAASRPGKIGALLISKAETSSFAAAGSGEGARATGSAAATRVAGAGAGVGAVAVVVARVAAGAGTVAALVTAAALVT